MLDQNFLIRSKIYNRNILRKCRLAIMERA